MKPKLKAPETKRLKLEYDEVLSNIAFKFNLPRYTKGDLVIVFDILFPRHGGAV
jgi:hypothetical protein